MPCASGGLLFRRETPRIAASTFSPTPYFCHYAIQNRSQRDGPWHGKESPGSLEKGLSLTFVAPQRGAALAIHTVPFSGRVALPAVPEPGAIAMGSLLSTTMVIGMVRGRRRKGIVAAA